MNEKEQVIA